MRRRGYQPVLSAVRVSKLARVGANVTVVMTWLTNDGGRVVCLVLLLSCRAGLALTHLTYASEQRFLAPLVS